MRRFLILAIALTGLLAFGATIASAAANFKSQSFSVNNQGQLICSFVRRLRPWQRVVDAGELYGRARC